MSITLAGIMGSMAYQVVKDVLLVGTTVTSAVDLGISAANRSDIKDIKTDASYIRSNMVKSADIQDLKVGLRSEFDALRGDVQLVGQQVGFATVGIPTTVENGAIQAVQRDFYTSKVNGIQPAPAINAVNQQLAQMPAVNANGQVQPTTPAASASVTVNTQPVNTSTAQPVANTVATPTQGAMIGNIDQVANELTPVMEQVIARVLGNMFQNQPVPDAVATPTPAPATPTPGGNNEGK